MIVPTGNFPQSTAATGVPLKVAPVMVKLADGAVLSIRTRTSWMPGKTAGGDTFGFFAVILIFHRPSMPAVVCQRPIVLVIRSRVNGSVASSMYGYHPSPRPSRSLVG